MDLNDAERYAVAALYTLALHSTHVETGVDKNGNSLSESDIAWGCPSEEVFDEHLLSQAPLRLPAELYEVFWGFDCMAPAGLAPRLYAWLKIPRKAWPGLLRMPDLAGSAGSPTAVEAFVALVRRYSAFIDPELAFTTGQVSRLQQHYTLPQAVTAAAAAAAGEDGDDPSKVQQQQGGSSDTPPPAAAATEPRVAGGSSEPAGDVVAAAAASITAAALAASRGSSESGGPNPAATAGSSNADQQQQQVASAVPKADNAPISDPAAAAAAVTSSCNQLDESVDHLPRSAAEGTVVPAATFTPAERYEHTTSHKAVLAMYELIGGCLSTNTEIYMEPLYVAAVKKIEAAAAAAAAGGGSGGVGMKQGPGSSSSSVKPAAAWFASDRDAEPGSEPSSPNKRSSTGSSSSSGSSTTAAAKPAAAAAAATPQQLLQGLALIQWYDARARVAVKRVAHWLRVPWPQVRAFEQMWAAQTLYIDPTTTQPKYSSSNRAMQYLKVGAAAVGGGALLAVTGGLAAPAIAAGLGAAVTLAHGGAAAAAAVAGFAGSSAGTAAVTGLFGAWGASVSGGSAGKLFGEVQEFGFLDMGQSIYTDGRPLQGYDKDVSNNNDSKAITNNKAGPGAEQLDVQDGSRDEPAAAAAAAAAGGSRSSTPASDRPQQQQQGLKSPTRLFGWVTRAEPAQAEQAAPDVDAATEGYQQLGIQDDPSTEDNNEAVGSISDNGNNSLKAAAAAGSSSGGGSSGSERGRGGFSGSVGDRVDRSGLDTSGQQQQQHALDRLGQQQQQHALDRLGQQQQQHELQRQPTDDHPLQPEWEPDWGQAQQQQQQEELGSDPLTAAAQPGSTIPPTAAAAAAGLDDNPEAGPTVRSSGSSSSSSKPTPSSPTAAAAADSSPSGISSWFSRKPAAAAAASVYVPLLPTPINPKHHSSDTRMGLTIAVNGCCIGCTDDYVRPWVNLPSRDCDRFALVWESACLKELGGALMTFLAQQALTQVTQKTIQTFLYTGLIGALALPMTLTTAMKVAFGNRWLVALRRAQLAGKMLAMQLLQGCHGGRPVTLIGCSMGARLIFHCLLELARVGARGCVENVILLGAPLSCRPDRWCAARSVVAGRLINGYSVNDWTLGLLYRVHSSSSLWLQAAGIWKIEVPGVENVNLSRLINGHSDYLTAMDEILEVINLNDA